MANCPKCGKPIPAGQEKCPSCDGEPLDLNVGTSAHINLLKKKLEKDPSNAKLHIELGDIYQKHGALNDALIEYQKAVKIDAKNFDAQIKSAYIYLRFKELDKAERAYVAALHIKPTSMESLIGLFRAYYLQDKTAEAIVLGEKIVRAKPDNVEFHVLMKNLYNRKGDKEKTFAELQKLESLTPNNEKIIKEIALHYRDENNMKKLIEYYNKLLDMQIDDIDLGFHIGKYYYENNEYNKAIEHLNRLLKKNITPEMAIMTRAYLTLTYFNAGDITESKNLADKIQPSEADQMDSDTQKKLASLLFQFGQNAFQANKTKQAIAFFEKAVDFDKETTEYVQMLNKIKDEKTLSNKKIVKKISIIAVGVIVVCILALLIWKFMHNKITIEIRPVEDVIVLIDDKPMLAESEKPGIVSSPTLLVGKYNVVVEKEGYKKWQDTVKIEFGKNTKLMVELIPIYYFLQLTSLPESAVVSIDGQVVGKTPFASDRMLACPHVVEVGYEGYATWRANLTVQERDSIDLGVITLKNLAGKWSGMVGKEAYRYNAAFNMTIEQENAILAIKYSHEPKANHTYRGKLKGKIEDNKFFAEGEVTYKYLKVFYWVTEKKKIVMQGEISDGWERIEGTQNLEGTGDKSFWVTPRQ